MWTISLAGAVLQAHDIFPCQIHDGMEAWHDCPLTTATCRPGASAGPTPDRKGLSTA